MRPALQYLLLMSVLAIAAGCERSRTAKQQEPEVSATLQANNQAESQTKPPGEVGTQAEIAAEEMRAAMAVIKAYNNRDLRKINNDQMNQLLDRITRLLPRRTYRFRELPMTVLDYRPWHIWQFEKSEQPPLHLLFEVENGAPNPIPTHVRLTAINDSGTVHAEAAFHTMSRHSLVNYHLEPLEQDQYPLIVLQTGWWAYAGKQYYALIGKRFDLVRQEDRDGKAKRNLYYGRAWCGPAVPKQTEQEWENDLASSDRLLVLRALVWLAARHRDAPPGAVEREREDIQAEDEQDMALVRKVRGRKKVITCLQELAESGRRWEREAAELALHPKDDRSN